MNNFTSARKKNHFHKQPIIIPISDLTQQSQHKRLSLDKQQSHTSSSRRKISSLQKELKDFPIICTTRTRLEYSGYKQYNFYKSKFGRFQSIKKENPLKYPERKYEGNLKNIIKLKKRFSLEPTYFKTLYKQESKPSKINQFKFNHQSKIYSTENNQEYKLRQLMRNILFHNNVRQRITTFYSKQYSGFSSQRLADQQTSADFQRYKSEFCSEITYRYADDKVNDDLKLPLSIINSSRKDKKQRMAFKTEADHSEIRNSEMEKELCGWQNNTQYGKMYNISLRNNVIKRKLKSKQ